jgi:hypothetical protein
VPVRASHTGVAPEHALPHIPQLLALSRGVSQPLAGFPSQSPKPALQVAITHVPAAHATVAFASTHALPHIPQLLALFNGVSQPLAGLPSQSPKPTLHESTPHVPATQRALPLSTVHVRPQAPQWLTSLAVSTQLIPQRVWPPIHPLAHVPVRASHTHTGVAPEHALPHIPQLLALSRGVSQPLAGFPSQSPKPI